MGVKAPADKRFKRGRVKTPRKTSRRWMSLIRPLVKWMLVVAILAYTTVRALARPGDLAITLGAGSIGTVGPKLLAALSARAGHPGGAR